VCEDSLFTAQQQLDAFLRNFPQRPIAHLLRLAIFPFGRPFGPPSDRLAHQLASLLLAPSATRDRLTDGIFINDDADDPLGRIERALAAVIRAESIEARLKDAAIHGIISGNHLHARVESAQQAGLITREEIEVLETAEAAVAAAVVVDAFDPADIH